MPVVNHGREFRPLRGGIAIFNPQATKQGTLGIIATSDGQDRWIVSCYHVLGRYDLSAFTDGEPIYQPLDGTSPLVARVALTRADSLLDCAAAKVEPGILAVPEILGLPPIMGVAEPVLGMRVLKSGQATGITEGEVSTVNGDEVEVSTRLPFADQYDLTLGGDSGAVWMSRTDGRIVALHKAGDSMNGGLSKSVRFSRVLAILNLQLVKLL